MNTCRFCLSNELLEDRPLFENNSYYVLGMREVERSHGAMVVLKRHAEKPFDINDREWSEIGGPLAFAKEMLRPFNASGYSVGWNVGDPAGQHVQHVHLHVICRFEDDPAAGLGINGLIGKVNGLIP
ncbi:HIT family protein [uncultured Tateyamaria sp.]|uniref:HIT family protein n=1 Tax=uncultured Tateyamaria sp. TaxID=455651 RepID=UPI0026279636|nr:HIT domain-containing protein [uncultured Tateyamaria sp.]